ncbi:MAG: PEP-CTERM sorting domain-containing protein [Chthoniobacterales bacterium]
MKIKSLLNTTALLGAAMLLLGGHSAKATLTYSAGDLFLGFRATDGQGANKDYLVNIGQASLYAPGGGSFNLNTVGVTGLAADLSANTLFGSEWNTLRSDDSVVTWAVFGTTYTGAGAFTSPVLFVTNQRDQSNISIQSTPWEQRSNGAQLTTVSKFQQVAGYYKDFGVATVNDARGTLQDATNASSYGKFTSTGLDFAVWATIQGDFSNGTSNSVLDLYRIDPGSSDSVYQGSFRINDSGIVTYTAAVPEPSSVALVGVVASLVAIIAYRRRKAAAKS